MTNKLREVVAFLLGETELDSVWFGEPHPSGKPYWWRDRLSKATLPTQSVGVEERWTSFARNDGEGGRVIDPSILDSPIYADQMKALRNLRPRQHKELTEVSAANRTPAHYCNPVAFFNGAACPECVDKHCIPSTPASESEQSIKADAYDMIAEAVEQQGIRVTSIVDYVTGLIRTPASEGDGGRVVEWQIMRPAFVTADENYSGKRVAAVYADASMIGQRVHIIPAASIDNTSKQEAGEAVAWAIKDHLGGIVELTASQDKRDQMLATNGGGRPLWTAEPLYTTPPRHPADEGKDALCIHCGRPTMHIGNVCFTCSKAAKNALQAGTP